MNDQDREALIAEAAVEADRFYAGECTFEKAAFVDGAAFAITRLADALSRPREPEGKGWKLVPIEPTETMLIAANKASLSTAVLMDDTRFACERATYHAAVEAALNPEQSHD